MIRTGRTRIASGWPYAKVSTDQEGRVLKPLFLCCALLALPGTGLAGGAQPAACGDISVAFYENGALFYQDGAGAWSGIDKDVVEELARRLGCRFHSHTD